MKTNVQKHQINLMDEIIVDNFAGGGGASTGIELATGRPVTIAINHDPKAILMHKTNHPHTLHLQEDVWIADPKELCFGRPVGLAWFSPDCKHFSKAKGSALVDRNIRGLAWVVLKWAGTVRPRVIILENVEEFKTWGPVRKGKPIKSKAGQTFQKWYQQLSDLGYHIECRELVAADYGAPTTRKRFVLIARCDGKPIVWPERTHAPRDSEEVKSGKCKPWVSAAEIIDWSLPCPSIFESSETIKEKYGLRAMRPLKDNTLRRIARGMDKFVIKNQKPFIVQVNHGGAERVSDAENPLGTITAKHGYGVPDVKLAPLHMHNNTNAAGTDMRSPVNTITTGGQQMLITPHISKYFGGVVGEDVKEPLPTVTAIDHNAVVSPKLSPYLLNHKFNNAPEDAQKPLSTVTAVNGHEVVTPVLVQYHTEQSDKENRASGFENPVPTVDGSNRYGVAAAHLTQYFKGDHYHSPDDPLHTVTTEIREGVTLAHLTEFKGQDIGQKVTEPLRTIMTKDVMGAVYTRLEKINGYNDLHFWPQVRELLNTYCGYNIAEDEILILNIDGVDYFISDIGLRMLTPAELYRAQGFPEDYIIEYDYTGKAYPKSEQVARCGNSVCPQLAKALVMANLPEYCSVTFSTMFALANHIAV